MAGTPVSDIEWAIRQTFPEQPDRAVRIAKCESGLSPTADNGQSVGLMQVHWPSHKAMVTAMGYTRSDLFKPMVNLAVARRIYDAAGHSFSPWTCR